MSVVVSVRVDASDLEAWSKKTARQLVNAIRSGVDKSARAARNDFADAVASDANVPKIRMRSGLPLIRATTATSLVATFTPSKTANSVRQPGGGDFPAGRLGTVSAATFVNTGGGSASLTLQRAFVIKNRAGGRVLLTRFGRGKSIKRIYAEMPNSAMAQDSAVPRRVWQVSAEQNLAALLPAAIQRVFDGLNPETVGGGALPATATSVS